MALGLSESGQQSAPLARAVIGGLLGSTVTTLLIMPVVYAIAIMTSRSTRRPWTRLTPIAPITKGTGNDEAG